MHVWEANCCFWLIISRSLNPLAISHVLANELSWVAIPHWCIYQMTFLVLSSLHWWDNILGLYCSVRTTAVLWVRVWWESKSRYLSVWIDFRNTDVKMDPSGHHSRSTSRKGSFPSDSLSRVNWIDCSTEFTWAWKASHWSADNNQEQLTIKKRYWTPWDPGPSPSLPSTTYALPMLPVGKLPERIGPRVEVNQRCLYSLQPWGQLLARKNYLLSWC